MVLMSDVDVGDDEVGVWETEAEGGGVRDLSLLICIREGWCCRWGRGC